MSKFYKNNTQNWFESKFWGDILAFEAVFSNSLLLSPIKRVSCELWKEKSKLEQTHTHARVSSWRPFSRAKVGLHFTFFRRVFLCLSEKKIPWGNYFLQKTLSSRQTDKVRGHFFGNNKLPMGDSFSGDSHKRPERSINICIKCQKKTTQGRPTDDWVNFSSGYLETFGFWRKVFPKNEQDCNLKEEGCWSNDPLAFWPSGLGKWKNHIEALAFIEWRIEDGANRKKGQQQQSEWDIS